MDWDLFRVMLEIDRGGSMQAAAEALGIDRATVLRRLNALETTLAASLFDRRSDGCTLTDTGRQIIGMVQGMEYTAAALRARVGGGDTRAEGTVSVALPEFLALTLLAPALVDFAAAYPEITLELHSGHRFLNLARGEADIALRNRRPEQHSLVGRRLGTVAIGLFATRAYLDKHPMAGSFAGHRMILFDDVLQPMPGVQALERRLDGARVLLRGSDLPAMMAATRSGAGIGCFPAVLAAGFPDLIPVAPAVGLPEVFLITRRDLRHQARVKAVSAFLTRRWGQMAGALSGRSIAEAFGDGPAPVQPADAAQLPRPS